MNEKVKESSSAGGAEDKQGKTRWMSESGIIDITIFLGPTPADVLRQYGKVTGNTPLPQVSLFRVLVIRSISQLQ